MKLNIKKLVTLKKFVHGHSTKRLIGIFSSILIMYSCSGCWDKIEVEDRLIVLGLGIDKYDNPKDKKDKYIVSYAIPNVSGGGQGGSSQSQSGGGGKMYNVSTIGPSFFEANRELTTRVDKDLFYGDAKTIIFGRKFLEDKKLLKYMIDVMLRQEQFSKTAVYAGCEGKAKDILAISPSENPFVGRYISGIISKESSNLRYVDGNGIRILKDLISSGDTMIPKISKGKQDLKVSGSYLIKNYKYCGELNGSEVRGIIIARNDVTQGVISSNNKTENIVYEMRSLKSKKDVKVKGNKVSVVLNINSQGDIAQYYSQNKQKPNETDLEKKISSKIKNEVEGAIKVIQKKYKIDVIGVGDYISKHYPKKWDEIKNNWDEEFSKINIKVNVGTTIKSTGTAELP